jgi:hypothetical protein
MFLHLLLMFCVFACYVAIAYFSAQHHGELKSQLFGHFLINSPVWYAYCILGAFLILRLVIFFFKRRNVRNRENRRRASIRLQKLKGRGPALSRLQTDEDSAERGTTGFTPLTANGTARSRF